MNEYQITFLVKDASTSACIAQPLFQLTKKFKSSFQIINITRNRKAQLDKSVAMLQAGLQQGDLCQITSEGFDAELASFVIKDMLTDFFTVIGAKVKDRFSTQLSNKVPQISPLAQINWHYAKAQNSLTKFECLKGLASLIYPDDPDSLFLAFIKREERSSTCVTSGISLPHVMFGGINQISIAVIKSDLAINWNSKMGNVNLAIALVMPNKLSKEQAVTATNLTRNLLCSHLTERLLLTKSGVDLQALLMYSASRLLH